jgi:hypothetical protein
MKFCPLISNVVRVGIGCGNYRNELVKNPCQRDECEFWVPECERFKGNIIAETDCDGNDCLDNERDYLECKGGCRLI